MAQMKSKYRLVKGTHMVPRPTFVQDKDPTEESHALANEGDVVELTDEQFKSFGDKFAPIGEDAVELRDDQTANLNQAKLEAAKTGQTVNPNKPK
jgi:hypothetical protein